MSKNQKILVIDDEPAIRSALCALFADNGYRVDTARDGDEGLRLFRSERHDIVMTNLYMPGKEGIETIGELREIDPDVPIVAMSGGDSRGYQRILDLALEFGATRTLRKPFRLNEVQALVEDLLDVAQAGTGGA